MQFCEGIETYFETFFILNFFQNCWFGIFRMAVVIFFGRPLIEMLSDKIVLTGIGSYLWVLPVFIFVLFCNLPISLLIIALDMKKAYFNYHSIGLITALIFLPLLVSLLEINGLLIGMILAEFSMILFGLAVLYRVYQKPNNS